jgi:large subunit ribosomal protein L25
VKLSGGMISHIQSELEISCLPKDIPENITVDIAELELGHSVHLSEVKLPANVELATPVDEEHDSPVVSCYEPKAEKIEEVEAAPADDEAGDTDDNTKADADADSKEEDSK